MVAIIRCSAAEARHIAVDLETFGRLKLEWTWRVNRPQSDWHQGAHLTLIVADDHGTEVVSWLGWTARLRRSGDLDRQLEVSRVEPVSPPVPLRDVVSRLDGRHARHVVHEGQQPQETGRALIKLPSRSARNYAMSSAVSRRSEIDIASVTRPPRRLSLCSVMPP